MRTIHAVFEGGIFRPVEPVNLPEGTRVVVEAGETASLQQPREIAPAGTPEGLLRVYEVLSRRYSSGHHDTAERHNEHQP